LLLGVVTFVGSSAIIIPVFKAFIRRSSSRATSSRYATASLVLLLDLLDGTVDSSPLDDAASSFLLEQTSEPVELTAIPVLRLSFPPLIVMDLFFSGQVVKPDDAAGDTVVVSELLSAGDRLGCC